MTPTALHVGDHVIAQRPDGTEIRGRIVDLGRGGDRCDIETADGEQICGVTSPRLVGDAVYTNNAASALGGAT